MRRFRVVDGSADSSLTAPAGDVAPTDPADPSLDETTESATPDAATAPAAPPPPATDSLPADGLVTARKGYDAAMQTTRKIRQRSLLDFLR
jgi:hypothetical protein